MRYLRAITTEKGTFTITNAFNRDIVMLKGQSVDEDTKNYVLSEMVKENELAIKKSCDSLSNIDFDNLDLN